MDLFPSEVTSPIFQNSRFFPILFVFQSFLYPTVFLLNNNSHLYVTSQITKTIGFVFLAALVSTLALWFFSWFLSIIFSIWARKIFSNTEKSVLATRIQGALLSGFGMAILLLLLFGAIRGIIFDKALIVYLYLSLIFGFILIGYFSEMKVANAVVICLILFNVLPGLFRYSQPDATDFESAKSLGRPLKEIVFKQKPNVYLVILESYNSLDIRKQMYEIDNVPLINTLVKYGFEIYKRVYANYDFTLASLSSVFTMDHHYYRFNRGLHDGGMYRKIIGGVINNPVFQVFLSNGYAIDFSQFVSTIYHPAHYLVGVKPQPSLQPLELFVGLNAVSKLLQFNLWDSRVFHAILSFMDGDENDQGRMNSTTLGKEKPIFSVIYTGAGHSPGDIGLLPPPIKNHPNSQNLPLWKLYLVNDYWVSTYKNLVAKSDSTLIDIVSNLCEKDPNALVILLGDHGAWLHRNRWWGENSDPNANILAGGISPETITRDIFEIFIAVKWPSQKPHGYFSHVNLFREVFAFLTEDDAILKTRVPDDSFAFDKTNGSLATPLSLYRTVSDGKPLERWEIYKEP